MGYVLSGLILLNKVMIRNAILFRMLLCNFLQSKNISLGFLMAIFTKNY